MAIPDRTVKDANYGFPDGTPESIVDVSVVIVNWNSLDLLRQCIRSIHDHTAGVSYEIIVVDNASPEGGVDQLPQEFPDLILIRCDQNRGFGRANNIGAQRACGRFVLLLNPDTRVEGNAITSLIEAAESLPDCGIAGAHLLNPDLTTQTSAIQKFPTILNQILDVEVLRLSWPACPLWDISPLFAKSSAPVKVEMISGACMLLERDVFSRVGGFSEEFFMYAEDLDLNYKVQRLGLASYYVPAARVIHLGGGSSSKRGSRQWATSMKARSLVLFYRKHRGPLYAFLFRVAMAASAIARLAAMLLIYPFKQGGDMQTPFSKWLAMLRWAIGAERLAG